MGVFDDARADRVMDMYDDFATTAFCCGYPPWFYTAWSVAGLIPLVKQPLSEEARARGDDPDCRPVALGSVPLRSLARAVIGEDAASAADYLSPQQLAVGVSGGVSTLIFGVRMLLEVRGDFVVVRLDMSNGFNAVSRSVLLRRLGEVPALAHWVPFLHALSGPGSDLLLGRLAMRLFEGEVRADSSEGTQQGLPPSSMAFSVAIQPELLGLDGELAAVGGAARAITDDVYAIGPPAVVFPAVMRFVEALRANTGLRINAGKSACWGADPGLEDCIWRQLAGVPVGRLDHDVHGAYGSGVMVGGVPVGDAAYVDEAVRVLGEGIESYIDTTVTQLQLHPHHLAASLYHAAQHRFMYWLRHLPPQHTLTTAQHLDIVVARAVERCGGYPGMLSDPLLLRRMRLPVRMRGCGFRPMEMLAYVAYAACFVEQSRAMVGTATAAGHFSMLRPVFGPVAAYGAAPLCVHPCGLCLQVSGVSDEALDVKHSAHVPPHSA